MRKAAFNIDGKWQQGHFNIRKFAVGDIHETRTGKLLVVEHVFDGMFNPGEGEMDGYFYKTRPATQAEVDEWNSSSIEEEKEMFEDFFAATETW